MLDGTRRPEARKMFRKSFPIRPPAGHFRRFIASFSHFRSRETMPKGTYRRSRHGVVRSGGEMPEAATSLVKHFTVLKRAIWQEKRNIRETSQHVIAKSV